MAKYGVVQTSNNLVINIIEWDGVATWSPPAGTTAVLSGGGAGDAEINFYYIGGTFGTSPS